MVFRFYSNAVSQASKSLAVGILIVGLLLIGFGTLILAFPEVFAALAAVVFFLIGFGCAATAFRIWWTQHQFDKQQNSGDYRHNVRVRDLNRHDPYY